MSADWQTETIGGGSNGRGGCAASPAPVVAASCCFSSRCRQQWLAVHQASASRQVAME
jgi:hypothetical protein